VQHVEQQFDGAPLALADWLTSCLMMAWRLLIVRRPPFSVTTTGSLSVSISSVFSPLRTDSLPLVSKIYWPENADDAIMNAP
jgi:hypothetical protein